MSERMTRLRDIPELSPSEFSFENSVLHCGVPTPCYRDTASGKIVIEGGFRLVGWCRNMPEHLMHGREGQIGLMLFSEEDGQVWEHYPLFDDDSRDAAVFIPKPRRPREVF